MIQVSPATAALLESNRYVAKPWLQVITPEQGQDFSSRVESVNLNFTLDQPVGTAKIGLGLGKGTASLSPFLQSSSYRAAGLPLFRPAALVEQGWEVSANGIGGELLITFRGRLDRVGVNSATGLLELQCRDMGAVWLNTVIPQPSLKLGTDAGVEAWEVMLALIQSAGSSHASPLGDWEITSPTVIREAPPDWMIYTYAQKQMAVLQAWRILAQQAGRDVRWFPRAGTSMVYYEPDRANPFPDMTISGRRYQRITSLEWGDEDVRNIWRIWWQEADSSIHGPVTRFNQASIDLYGPRYSQIYLDRAENIKSETNATNFADLALADSQDPFASHATIMGLEPRLELNDRHRYLANGREYDVDMDFNVSAYRHEWTAARRGRPGRSRTTVACRPKALAAYREYRLSKQPAVLVSTFDVPGGLQAAEKTLYLKVPSVAFAA